jgi:dCMP deaminase
MNRFHNFYMSIALGASKLSRSTRLQVGAVVVKDGNIRSFGYNGTPPGWNNECEIVDEAGNSVTSPHVIHAEMNSLLKLARDGGSGNGAVMYCTHSPCIDCAKSIATAGISKVYYRHEYRKDDGVKFLEKFGVEVEQLA